MKKILILLMLVLMANLVYSVNAEQQSLGTFKLGECVELIQTCGNCTSINITSVNNKSDAIIVNISMSKDGTEFSYDCCNCSNNNGEYILNGVADVDGTLTVFAYNYFVTLTGKDMNTSKSIIYLFVLIVSFLIFLGLLFVGIALPVSNKKDEMTGYILAVNNLKYLKIFSLAFAYLTALFISFLTYSMTKSYLDMDFLTNIFRFIFIAITVTILPFFILLTYFLIANLIKDSKINELLLRGLKVK